jgi:uncharacterized membrane protein HdeD (DUF308 family)
VERNVGTWDAITRGVIAVLLGLFGVFVPVPGLVSFIAILLGIVLMATALTRECPFYRLFHLATLHHHHRHV